MGTYDVGYYGMGYKPWSTMKYYVSAYIDETNYTTKELYAMEIYGWAGNGAECTGPGVGGGAYTVYYGTSGGHSGADGRGGGDGENPTGGGGAGYSDEYWTTMVEDPENPGTYITVFDGWKSFTVGSSGGQGKLSITITKGIVNRQVFGDILING
jgi:hypothetical protein